MLSYRILGNTEGRTVLFLHGWPDTDRVFDKQYEALEKDYRIVTFSLPFYDDRGRAASAVRKPLEQAFKRYGVSENNTTSPFFGLTFDAIIFMFKLGIEDAMKGRTPEEEGGGLAPMLICHDWGACISWELLHRYPKMVSKIVALDIGMNAFHLRQRPFMGKEFIIIIIYQWVNIFLYFLPWFLGDRIIRKILPVLKAPDVPRAHAGMGYLYYQVWKMIIFGGLPATLAGDVALPAVPILFMHAKKGIRFYSKKFAEELKTHSSGGAIEVIEGDHWFMRRSRTVDQVNRMITAFLK